MSPEQIERKPYTFSADIYSLGIIFFELIHSSYNALQRENLIKDARNNIFPSGFLETRQVSCFEMFVICGILI